MAQYDYDLFTIGAGSGGVRASRMSAYYGAKVAVAEERYSGRDLCQRGLHPEEAFGLRCTFRRGLSRTQRVLAGRWANGMSIGRN